MADSCRTSRKGRKGRTKSDDATLSRGSSAKASATVRALRTPPRQPEVVVLLLISRGRAPPGPPSPPAENAPRSGRDSLKTWLFNPRGLADP
jgi:hypothetical protein